MALKKAKKRSKPAKRIVKKKARPANLEKLRPILQFKAAKPLVEAAQQSLLSGALLQQEVYRSSHRASKAEGELALIKSRLVRLLSDDQLEAAKTCGISPSLYALECIDLYKERMFPQLPRNMRPLAALQTHPQAEGIC
jgi:hypothetical protein